MADNNQTSKPEKKGFFKRLIEVIKQDISEKIAKLKYIFKGETPKVKDVAPVKDISKSSAAEIMNISDIFSEYQNSIRDNIRHFENEVIKICSEYFNDIVESFDEANSTLNIYNPEIIKNKIRKSLDGVKGEFSRHISRRISIDDEQCMSIMKMMPGDSKAERMVNFRDTVVSEALGIVANKLEECSDDFLDMLDFAVSNRFETLEEKIEEKTDRLFDISTGIKEKNNKAEAVCVDTAYEVCICEMIENTCENF